MQHYKKRMLLPILIFLFQSYAQQSFSTTELEGFKKEFRNYVQKKMKKHDVTGLSISMEIENQRLFEEGFGFSDRANNARATKDTEYPIGSVSKIITSTAILKLYSDDVIDINKPYKYYVEDFSMKSNSDYEENFTIRHLLSHYAGLPRLMGKGFLKKEPQPLESLLTNSKDEYLIAPPGEVYQYSDWGVDLLSLLVERVSEMRYEEYVQEHIFKPLGMNHSYFGPAQSTKGYNKGVETETYKYSYSGSDGVTSSASDMLKIVQLYTHKGKLSGISFLDSDIVENSLKKQFEEASLAFDTEVGLMWDVRTLKNGNTRVKKAGIHEPFFTYIFFIPEYSASIVICSNSNSSSAIHWDSWGKLYSFLGKKYDFQNNQSPLIKKKALKKINLTENQFKKIEGSYSTDLGILELKRNDGKFDVNLKLEGKKGIGIPYEDGLLKLYVKALGVKVHAMDIFWKEIDGKIMLGEQHKSGKRTVFGSKINTEISSDFWKNATGKYLVDNYDNHEYKTFETIQLIIDSNGIFQISGHIEFPRKMEFQLGLSLLSDELAVIPGYNFDFFGGETVKLKKEQGIYYLTLSGYKFKRLN